MGKKENPLLAYYDQNDRFAQLLNGWLFQGRNYFTPADIERGDRRLDGASGKEGEGRLYRSRYRDLFKKLEHTYVHLYIGTELMEHVDYSMPLRVMDCDTLSYLHQKKEHSKTQAEQEANTTAVPEETSRKQKLTSDEFLYAVKKEDRLLPVITLVLYCGERRWNGATRLHEMLDMEQLPEELRGYVEDYAIHVLDVRHTSDEVLCKFPEEVSFLLMCIKYAKDKTALLTLLRSEVSGRVSRDTFETIGAYMKMPKLLESKEAAEGGTINMENGFLELLDDAKKEGVTEGRSNGLTEGIEWAKKIFRLAGEGLSPQEIAGTLSIPLERVMQALE